MVQWLTRFAQSMVEYWETGQYKKARKQSDTAIETWGARHQTTWRGELVSRQHGLTPQQEHVEHERILKHRSIFATQQRNERFHLPDNSEYVPFRASENILRGPEPFRKHSSTRYPEAFQIQCF